MGKLIGRNRRSRSGDGGTGVSFCIDADCTKMPEENKLMLIDHVDVERLTSIERTGEVPHTAHATVVFASRFIELDAIPKVDTERNTAEILDRSHLKYRVSIDSCPMARRSIELYCCSIGFVRRFETVVYRDCPNLYESIDQSVTRLVSALTADDRIDQRRF